MWRQARSPPWHSYRAWQPGAIGTQRSSPAAVAGVHRGDLRDACGRGKVSDRSRQGHAQKRGATCVGKGTSACRDGRDGNAFATPSTRSASNRAPGRLDGRAESAGAWPGARREPAQRSRRAGSPHGRRTDVPAGRRLMFSARSERPGKSLRRRLPGRRGSPPLRRAAATPSSTIRRWRKPTRSLRPTA